jgi:hypothetical protein
MLVGMRLLFSTAPLFVGAFILGQSVGGRLRGRHGSDPSTLPTREERG